MGPSVPADRPDQGWRREAARAADRRDHGGKLPQHQGSPGPDVRCRGVHDQGQEPRADPRPVQHRERLHTRGGGEDPRGEQVVRGVIDLCQTRWDDRESSGEEGEAEQTREAGFPPPPPPPPIPPGRPSPRRPPSPPGPEALPLGPLTVDRARSRRCFGRGVFFEDLCVCVDREMLTRVWLCVVAEIWDCL